MVSKRSNRSHHGLQHFAQPTSLSLEDLDAAQILMTLANSHIAAISSHSSSRIPAISPSSHIAKKPSKRKRIGSSKLHESTDLGMVDVDECKVERSYSCRTCSREFSSFQALGGHRASCLNKPKSCNGGRNMQEAEHLEIHEEEESGLTNGNPGNFQSFHGSKGIIPNVGTEANSSRAIEKAKVHKCPVCDRVFSCGQALGGHQGSHRTRVSTVEATSSTLSSIDTPPVKSVSLLGLNMPAPLDPEHEQENSVGSCSQIVTYRLPHHYDQKFGLGLDPSHSRLEWGSMDFPPDDEAHPKVRFLQLQEKV